MAYAIGCDLGSQSLKGVLLDPGGCMVAEASSPYEMAIPHPNWAEQNPADWVEALGNVVRALLRRAGLAPAEVGTLALASQVDGLVAVDGHGKPLRPAIIWLDRRAESECDLIRDRVGDQASFEITGLNLDSSHVAPKILWLRNHEPRNYAAAAKLQMPGSYLVSMLTGETVFDYSNASSTLLYDVRQRDWSPALLGALDIDPSLLGPVVAAVHSAGCLTVSAAVTIGLHPGTRVLAGCGDEHAACLGAGLVAPGVICDISGTAEPVAVTTAEPVFDQTRLVELHGHADPRWWLVENPGFVSGGSVLWLSRLLGAADPQECLRAADRVPAGAEGLVFLPCLSGAMTPVWNGSARGVFFGLSMKHERAHMARAVLEGCAFALRDIVDRFAELGLADGEIRVTGGGTRSPLWCQIKADVTGRSIRTLAAAESTALGAAALAATAEGTFASLDEAAARLVKFSGCYEPCARQTAVYQESYAMYRRLYAALDPIFPRSAAN